MAGISNISSSYQVQGSSASTTISDKPVTAAAAPAAEVENVSPVSIKESTGRKNDDAKGEEYTPSNEALQEAVKVINNKLGDSKAVFGIHEETNKLTIKIVDKDTDKVRKEYPVEETLDALARLWESAGILVDEKR